jgi:hypothetical protein
MATPFFKSVMEDLWDDPWIIFTSEVDDVEYHLWGTLYPIA